MKLRMSFSKDDTLKYISHLDLRRAFTRAVRRSRLPVVYTQGFNPHPDLVFSPPISVGFTSRCEILEMALENDVPDFGSVKNALNNALPAGIRILSVWEPVRKISEIMYSAYEITFCCEGQSCEDIENTLKTQPLSVVKKTKTSEYSLNLSEHIKDLSLIRTDDVSIVMRVCLPTGNDLTVNPRLIFDALNEFYNAEMKIIKIERIAIFDSSFSPFQ